ncbi:MAG TPA: excinuclease ABC subunit UvrB [Patescibacteria group bacterium]|nr:excinuclease ABC subunit UvrB [Patescibacteria group bacterium]
MSFKLKIPFSPAGDQPDAIRRLVEGLGAGERFQTLLGVTGSGKTFTMANVIQAVQRSTLVLAPNKTLAAQLCNEFREFFPENAVEYFVSYYDYYQPEAYLPRTDTYIEKEAMINNEIDRLRHSATQALLSRRDVIVVSSVSCIYSLGSPVEYERTVLRVQAGDRAFSRGELIRRLVDMRFERLNTDLIRGTFRARGDVIEIMPMNEEVIYRMTLQEDCVVRIQLLDPVTRRDRGETTSVWIFPAKHYVIATGGMDRALAAIREELAVQLTELEKEGKLLEAERIKRRTNYDLELIEEVGYCNGIENYSRYFDGRQPGEPPYTLLDYFPKDFLLMIDESHVTVPQIGGMSEGDRARKGTLVEHGFRLPSAKDNRPLTFVEFQGRTGQTIFTSATPGPYERNNSSRIVEQIIRPTGLIDPEVLVRPITPKDGNPGQVDDVIAEIRSRTPRGERTLITTLTKKMAEDLTTFLSEQGMKVSYVHSDVDTLERIEILTEFRRGTYDVLVGVNLLREGLDLPEVTLVAIMDADKEGFLRSETSLIQTIGRAARNVLGQVILYADEMTGSMHRALQETERRRKLQLAYNKKHGITPQTIKKGIRDIREMIAGSEQKSIEGILDLELMAEPHEIEEVIQEKLQEMKKASMKLDFETAAVLRDEIVLLKKELREKEKI